MRVYLLSVLLGVGFLAAASDLRGA